MLLCRLIVSVFVAVVLTACLQTTTELPHSPIPEQASVHHGKERFEHLSKMQVIDQMMAESGMDTMIDQVPAMVVMGLEQQPAPPIARHEYNAFKQHLLDTFEPVRIRQIVVDYLDEHYESERFIGLLQLLKNPLVKKMTQLEVEANMPEAQQEMMQMANIIMGQVPPQRLDMIRKLDEATRSTQASVDIQMIMAKTMMTNMNKIVPQAQRMSEVQLAQSLEQMRMASIFPTRQYVELLMVYAYRSVSDEELEKYLELYESELGYWSTGLMLNAWMRVSEEVSFDLAQRMQKTFIKHNML